MAALGQELRYLVFTQKVGRGETGVLALTVYAEIPSRGMDSGDEEPDDSPSDGEVVVSSPTESVTWTFTDEPGARWDDVAEVLDTTLAAALHRFTLTLGRVRCRYVRRGSTIRDPTRESAACSDDRLVNCTSCPTTRTASGCEPT